jgi:ribosomal protein S6-L-glutamate ligase RimK-like protein
MDALPRSSRAPSRVYAIHENRDWFGPFAAAFDAAGVPYEEWLLIDGDLDLDAVPPQGIFWSRISASSHTRGHTLSKDYARSVLGWLESHGRRTVNGRRVLELEMSKIDQLTALKAAGIDVPRTVAVVGSSRLPQAARAFQTPFIVKHNQGGKGAGVRLFTTHAELEDYVHSEDFEEPQDGITLLQEYVPPTGGLITRVEIVGGQVVYALTADTTLGGFQLCPAGECAVAPAASGTGAGTARPVIVESGQAPKLFALREAFHHPILEKYLAFTRRHGIEIAGIEFIEAPDGRLVTYDVNTNTNYNPDVEAVAPQSGPGQIAHYLKTLLNEEWPREVRL